MQNSFFLQSQTYIDLEEQKGVDHLKFRDNSKGVSSAQVLAYLETKRDRRPFAIDFRSSSLSSEEKARVKEHMTRFVSQNCKNLWVSADEENRDEIQLSFKGTAFSKSRR